MPDIGIDLDNNKQAVLLLGHGSKMAEANDTLRRVARTLEAEGGYGFVQPAFLQMENPDFQQAFAAMVDKGFSDITIMPYFLYMGAHVQKDLPDEIEAAIKKFPGVRTRVTRNLGFHFKLIDIVMERIGENGGGAQSAKESPESGEKRTVPTTTHPIEEESMRIIEKRLGLPERLGSPDALGFDPSELAVLKRVIHTTADFEFKDLMRFSPGAVKAGVSAIRNGCNIITDVKMVKAGVPNRRIEPFGCSLFCFSSDPDVIRAATLDGMTRTAASMKKASRLMTGAIVAIGNAPTALRELVAMIRRAGAAPALVVGVPVGFVGAAEAKEELAGSAIEYITSVGNKGGSTVAAAIVNALAIIAGNQEISGGG